jgi:hypothetical protein
MMTHVFKQQKSLCLIDLIALRAILSILSLFFIVMLMGMSPLLAQSNKKIKDYLLSTPGYQDVALLSFKNQNTKGKEIKIGIQDSLLVKSEVKGLSQKSFLIECRQKSASQEVPKFQFSLDGQFYQLPKIMKYDGDENTENPIIWIDLAFNQSSEYEMQQAVKKVHGILPIRISEDQFPTHFSVMSKAPLIIIGINTFLKLNDDQKQILKASVFAGAMLLIAVGDSIGQSNTLAGFSDIQLGGVEPPEDGYSSRVSSHRALFVGSNSRNLVIMDKTLDENGQYGNPKTLIAESPLGMGKVRVVGVRLNQLLSSQLYKVAFLLTLPETWKADLLNQDSLKKEKNKQKEELTTVRYEKVQQPNFEQLSNWLNHRFEPLSATPHLFHSKLFYMIIIAIFLYMISKRSVIYLGITFLSILVIAFSNVPLSSKIQTHQAKLIYLPMDEGAVVLGMMDINFYYQGEQMKTLNLPFKGSQIQPQISLLETQTQGLCLLHEAIDLNPSNLEDHPSQNPDDQTDEGANVDERSNTIPINHVNSNADFVDEVNQNKDQSNTDAEVSKGVSTVELQAHLQGSKIENLEHSTTMKIEYEEDYDYGNQSQKVSYLTTWFLNGQLGTRQRIKFIAIVDHIPQALDQTITITSEGPWKGSKLTTLMPPNLKTLPIPSEIQKIEAWQIEAKQAKPFKPLILN